MRKELQTPGAEGNSAVPCPEVMLRAHPLLLCKTAGLGAAMKGGLEVAGSTWVSAATMLGVKTGAGL